MGCVSLLLKALPAHVGVETVKHGFASQSGILFIILFQKKYIMSLQRTFFYRGIIDSKFTKNGMCKHPHGCLVFGHLVFPSLLPMQPSGTLNPSFPAKVSRFAKQFGTLNDAVVQKYLRRFVCPRSWFASFDKLSNKAASVTV